LAIRQKSGLKPTLHSKALSPVLGDVAFEVQLGTLWNQTSTAFLTAAFDAIAACFRCHAGAETMLLFASTFGRLVGAEAHSGRC